MVAADGRPGVCLAGGARSSLDLGFVRHVSRVVKAAYEPVSDFLENNPMAMQKAANRKLPTARPIFAS